MSIEVLKGFIQKLTKNLMISKTLSNDSYHHMIVVFFLIIVIKLSFSIMLY